MSDDLVKARPPFPTNPPTLRDNKRVHLPYGPWLGRRTAADQWHLICKYAWEIVTAVIVTGSLVAAVTFQMKPVYEAVARIEIARENPILVLRDSVALEQKDDEYVETQIQALSSNRLAVTVIHKLNLQARPEFGGMSARDAILPSLDEADSWERQRDSPVLNAFLKGLNVERIPRSRTVEIRYTCSDGKLAADIANTLAESAVEMNFRAKVQATQQASEWLTRELSSLQAKVQASEQKLVDYERTTRVLSLPEEQTLLNQKLGDLNRELTSAETERYRKETLYQAVRDGNLDVLLSEAGRGEDLGQAALQRLEEKKAAQRDQLAELKVQYGPNHPRLLKLRNQMEETQSQIQAERQRVVKKAAAEYEAAQRREKLLRDAMAGQQKQMNELSQLSIPYNLLKRDVEANKQMYDGLLQRAKEASASAGLKSSDVRIIDPALQPLRPAGPKRARNVVLGLLFGLVLGVAYAFIRERLDNTINTPDQIEQVVALPLLGFIPMLAGSVSGNGNGRKARQLSKRLVQETAAMELVPLRQPNSGAAEAYRSTRTSLLLSTSGQPPQVILVTSAQPQEGKTTTALNLAISLAQFGGDVLIVDADLRRPRVATTFKLDLPYGLSNVLTGTYGHEQVIQAHPEVPHLHILASGPRPPNPAELLGSQTMRTLLLALRSRFTTVIIDSPPVLGVTDATLLSALADGTVVVARGGQTTRESLRLAVGRLEQVNAKILGTLLNGVLMESSDYYYYYHRNYGYGAKDKRNAYYYYDSEKEKGASA